MYIDPHQGPISIYIFACSQHGPISNYMFAYIYMQACTCSRISLNIHAGRTELWNEEIKYTCRPRIQYETEAKDDPNATIYSITVNQKWCRPIKVFNSNLSCSLVSTLIEVDQSNDKCMYMYMYTCTDLFQVKTLSMYMYALYPIYWVFATETEPCKTDKRFG